MQNIVFNHKDYTEYAWNSLLDKLEIPKSERKDWISSVMLNMTGKTFYTLLRPDTKLEWDNVVNIVKKRFGELAEVKYDDLQHGYNVRYRSWGISCVISS